MADSPGRGAGTVRGRGDRAGRLPANRDKSQDLSSGDTNANSFVILPQARRVAKSRVCRAEPHTLGPVCETVQRH